MEKKKLLLLIPCFILLPSLMGTSAMMAQQNGKYERVVSNQPLTAVLKQLEEKFSQSIVFNYDELSSYKVNAKISATTAEEAIKQALTGLPVTYTVKGKTITVKSTVKTRRSPNKVVVEGIVSDEDGEPIPGATIKVPGNRSLTTVTDAKGRFTLELDKGKGVMLGITFLGMKDENYFVNCRKDVDNIAITMKEDGKALDEVVVIGYGSVSRKDLTGSISTFDTKIIESSAAPNLTAMIQGQIPGVSVMLGDGSPGSSAKLEIRGASSLTGDTSPLIVIDDIPMSSDYDLNMLNPADVKSLNVLKGASATAIYGSRASGGVIMITTKLGNRNSKPVINYSFDLTNSYLMDDLRTLSADEFKTLMLEACRNEARAEGYEDISQYYTYKNITTPGFFGEENTEWMKLLMQDAVTQQHRVSIQGGTPSSSYNASFSYLDQQGMIKGLYNKRYTYTVGFNTDITQQLKSIISVNGNFTDNNKNARAMDTAVEARPDVKAFNDDGSYFHQTYLFGNRTYTMKNPLAEIEDTKDNEKQNNITISASLERKPINGLNVVGRYSYQNYNRDEDYYASSETYQGSDNWSGDFNGYGKRTHYKSYKHELEFRANYSLLVAKNHFFNLTAAGTWNKDCTEGYWMAMKNYGDDDVQNGIWQATEPYSNYPKYGYSYGSMMVSMLGRLEYKFKNRYILNASMRRDGSSRFSPKSRWGNFPSFAAAWIISDEKPVKEHLLWLTFLKLKGGWGKVGNGWVSEYAWRTMFTNAKYQGMPAIIPSQVGNDDLKWEETSAWDIGLEFGILKNQRIRGNIGYYSKKTDGLLYDLELAPSLGMNSTRVNYACIDNRGVELDIIADIIKNHVWNWSCTFNISKNKNKVTNINGDYVSTPGSAFLTETIIKEGESLGLIYGFQTEGLFQNQQEIDYYELLNKDHRYQSGDYGRNIIPGDLKYVDQNGDGWVNIATNAKDDRVVLGCSRPDFEGGFSTRLSWKNLTLNVQTSFAVGHEKYWKAASTQFQFNSSTPNNVLDIALNRWTPENPDATYPCMRLNKYQNEVVDRYVYNASYWKIQNVALDYRIPDVLVRKYSFLNSLVLSFSVNNVAIFTSYPGPSPESFSANVIRGGSVDYSTYPQSRNFNFSLKASL